MESGVTLGGYVAQRRGGWNNVEYKPACYGRGDAVRFNANDPIWSVAAKIWEMGGSNWKCFRDYTGVLKIKVLKKNDVSAIRERAGRRERRKSFGKIRAFRGRE